MSHFVTINTQIKDLDALRSALNAVVLTLKSDGSCTCFYTEAIDLTQLGRLEVKRATVIEFNNETQLWEVVDGYGEILFQHASRAACLGWEQKKFKN